jgi:hypothetical protein
MEEDVIDGIWGNLESAVYLSNMQPAKHSWRFSDGAMEAEIKILRIGGNGIPLYTDFHPIIPRNIPMKDRCIVLTSFIFDPKRPMPWGPGWEGKVRFYIEPKIGWARKYERYGSGRGRWRRKRIS